MEEKKSVEAHDEETTICVVGDGNAAHVLIPFLGETHHRVNLMSLQPEKWSKDVTCEVQNMQHEILHTFHGKINKLSSNFADVIPDADIIILCIPVHQYRNALKGLAPHVNRSKKEVFIGTIYGQAGFNWMVHEMERKNNITNTVAFSIGLIPFICRAEKYGSVGHCYGGKKVNVAAVTPPDRFDHLNEIFLKDICYTQLGVGKFVQACSFISLTLSVDNQIIHPARCYGLYKRYGGKWKTYEEVPFFYRDFDEISAESLKKLDDDYTAVRDAIRKHWPDRPFKYMLNYLDLEAFSHQTKHLDSHECSLKAIRASFTESEQLGRIKSPVKQQENGEWILDYDCRFFTDDIPYGVLIVKWIAEKLNVNVPFIDELILWVQEVRNETFLTKDTPPKIDYQACLAEDHTTGIPPTYGIESVENILD